MSTELQYPEAKRGEASETFHGTVIADPYRWMEDLDSPELQAWIEAENSLTQSFLAAVPARTRIHARLMELVNFERFSMPARQAGRLFFQRNSGLQNQSVLYWQQGQSGEARMLLDPNTLSADGTVSLGAWSVNEDGTLLAYALQDAGSDVSTIHVRNVETGQDLPDRVEWVKFSGIHWAKDGGGFYYSGFGAPPQTQDAEVLKQVQRFHKLWFHTLGSTQPDALVYERPDQGEMLVSGGVSEDGRWLVLSAGRGSKNTLLARDLSGSLGDVAIAPEDDAIYSWLGSQGSRAWVQTDKDAGRGRVVEVDLALGAGAADQSRWNTVVPEGAEPLEAAVMAGGRLVLQYLQDAKSRVELRSLDGTQQQSVVLPGIGAVGIGGGRPQDTEIFFAFTNYTQPAAIYRLDLHTGQTSIWRQPALRFDPGLYETRQVFATSRDGTRVPLFVTARKDLPRNGQAPAILYGYGGFNISLGPAYSSGRLAWLEMGGIYAEAILRGGGEYGEDWHQAGTGVRKQNVFDDCIACAEALIAEGYTSAARLAVNGGSNGGLLAAAVAMQRPDLFGAAVPQVGVLDMLRFDQFTIGYAWKPEYGDVRADRTVFDAVLRYSPLHNVRPGVRYPAMLVTTADHDDRVFPAHSFKYIAELQAASSPEANPALIHVETRAGHGGGMPLAKQMELTADMYAFLVRALKIEPAEER